MSEDNNTPKKKSARASIASMDYAGLSSGNSNFGMGKAARSLVSGPLSNPEAKIIELELIDSNPNQPRTHFDKARLEELAADIKERGILQPPVVRDMKNGRFQIVAGERRCRAARIAGLTEIPVIVREFENEQKVKLASLAENLQRDDLDIEDEIRFLKILQDEMKLTLRQIAEVIHRSHLYVYRRLDIANQPELIQLYREGRAGIEILGKIAKIENASEREKAINALTAQVEFGNKPISKEEANLSVTERNKITPVYNFTRSLSNLKIDRLKAEEKQELNTALKELETLIATLKKELAR